MTYRDYVGQLVARWARAYLPTLLQRQPTEAELANWIASLMDQRLAAERLAANQAAKLGGTYRWERPARVPTGAEASEPAPTVAAMILAPAAQAQATDR